MENTDATLKEVEQIAAQFGEDSWQVEKRKQLTADAKGRYFARLADLSDRKKEKETQVFNTAKSVEEYDYWTMNLSKWYYEKRLESYLAYLKEVKAEIPAKLGDKFYIPAPPKRIKNTSNIGKYKSYGRRHD